MGDLNKYFLSTKGEWCERFFYEGQWSIPYVSSLSSPLCVCFSVSVCFLLFVSVSLSASPTSRLLVVFRDLLCETMRWGQVAKKRLSASAFFVYWISDDAMVTCDVILSEVGFLGLSRVLDNPAPSSVCQSVSPLWKFSYFLPLFFSDFLHQVSLKWT